MSGYNLELLRALTGHTGPVTPPTDWSQTKLRQLVPVGTDIPAYDSPAWHVLPEDSPLRLAAAIRAAEARRSEIAEGLEDLAREMDEEVARSRELHDRVAMLVTGTARRLVARQSR